MISIELRTLIQDATHQLEDKLRLPIYMYYTADMTVEEIALALGIPQEQ